MNEAGYGGYGFGCQPMENYPHSGGSGYGYAFVLVLFILLVIIGCTCIK